MVVSYFFPTENPHENFAKVSNMYFLLVRKTTTRCVPISNNQSTVKARIGGIRFREILGLVERRSRQKYFYLIVVKCLI